MCDCPNKVLDRISGTRICVDCGTVTEFEPTTDNDWYSMQDNVFRKNAPYKYSRTTHFRNSLDRVLGYKKIKSSVIDKCRKALQGYETNQTCYYNVLKASGLPYQDTTSIRRKLINNVPDITSSERQYMNTLFENFCVYFEANKKETRKNLPSLEYLIFSFLTFIQRDDLADLIMKRYITLEKKLEAEQIVTQFLSMQTDCSHHL